LRHSAQCFPLRGRRKDAFDSANPVKPSIPSVPNAASLLASTTARSPLGARRCDKIVRKNHAIVLSATTHRGYFLRPMAFAPLWRRCLHLPAE
jgi:hypothetical protein